MNCIVCKRIPPKIIFGYLHKLLDSKIDKETINKIGKRICFIINELDKKYRFFFCGKAISPLLSGIFYLIINDENVRVTQREISALLPTARPNIQKKWHPLENPNNFRITEVTVRNSVYNWLKMRKYIKEIPEYYANKYDKGII